MNKSMIEYFGLLDEKYVEEAAPEKAKVMWGIRRRIAARITAAAACFFLIFGASASLFHRVYYPQIPVYENAAFSAWDIGSLFGSIGGYGTSAYQKIEVPSTEYLQKKLHAIPTPEYLPIYRLSIDRAVSKDDLTSFADPIISRISKETGIDFSGYDVIESENAVFTHFTGSSDSSAPNVHVRQENGYNSFCIRAKDPKRLFSSGDISLEVDISESEEEILTSIEPLKEKLFYIFGKEFSDAKISYDHDSVYIQNSYVSVFLYNDSDNDLNKYNFIPVSDYIRIFYDVYNDEGDISVTIEYRQMLAMPSVNTEAKMISLSDAEKFLYNGYVFGGHACPRCVQEQDAVDFHGYDLAGITYIGGEDISRNMTYIPFYEFYKQIGKAENGDIIYARTYVPAIEVNGYEEYFKSLTEIHDN